MVIYLSDTTLYTRIKRVTTEKSDEVRLTRIFLWVAVFVQDGHEASCASYRFYGAGVSVVDARRRGTLDLYGIHR